MARRPNESAGNRTLSSARSAKQDEFYTQLADIENELRHYKDQFKGKVVLCNCDDPYESNFFNFFASKFNEYGLKKLICTSYKGSPIAYGQMVFADMLGVQPQLGEADELEPTYLVEITNVPDLNGDGTVNILDVELLLKQDPNVCRRLYGDSQFGPGDFRSKECLAALEEADIVVTNPPFSLFREFIALLEEKQKQFLIIGNVNAITYKEVFKLIKANRLWLGPSISSGDREFRVPDTYPLQAAGWRVDTEGVKYIRVKGVRWFTNLDHERRHELLRPFKPYSPEAYPSYDNFDAIEVGKVADIPKDFDGVMGVPITFLDKYNPGQFEIVGITQAWDGCASKIYPAQTQVNKDGSKSTVTKLNDGAAVAVQSPPFDSTYYIVDGQYFVKMYCRILVKLRKK